MNRSNPCKAIICSLLLMIGASPVAWARGGDVDSAISWKKCALCDLRYGDFSKRDLKRFKVPGAFLYSANLSWSNLDRADFESAQLTGANIEWSGLDDAVFAKANIEEATFFRSSLRNADFRSARADRANFSEAVLANANFATASLVGSDFSSAELVGANLRNADLRNANLRKSELVNASFKGSRLSGAELEGIRSANVDFSGASMQRVNFAYTHLEHVNFRRANLAESNFTNAILDGVNFEDSSLRGADFRNATFRNVVFADADLCDAVLPNGQKVSCVNGKQQDDSFRDKPMSAPAQPGQLLIAVPGNMYADLHGGRPRGVIAELVDDVLTEKGYTVRYVVMSSGESRKAMADGMVDMALSVLVLGQPKQGTRYSRALLREYTVPLALTDADVSLQDADDLGRYRVGGREGYRYPGVDENPGVELNYFPKDGDILRALLLGRLDLALISSVSDLNTFRAESILHEFQPPARAVGFVDLGAAFSTQRLADSEIDAIDEALLAAQATDRWHFILQRNGIGDLVKEWPLLH